MKKDTQNSPATLALDPGARKRWVRLFDVALKGTVGVVFCASGLLKLVNHSEFVSALSSYGLLADGQVDLAAMVIPHEELIMGMLLAFGVKTKTVSSILFAKLIFFTLLTAIAMLKGRAVDCGCFPVEGAHDAGNIGYFVRNGLLILACLWIALRAKRGGGVLLGAGVESNEPCRESIG